MPHENFLMHMHHIWCNNAGPRIAIVRKPSQKQAVGVLIMWMQKLSDGVLRVLTPLGPRYIRPTFLQRVYILWIFRHFRVLPLQVLSRRQRALIESLCAQQRFVSLSPASECEYAPILGTVERRPPVEVETAPPRKSSAGVAETVSPMTADAQQRP